MHRRLRVTIRAVTIAGAVLVAACAGEPEPVTIDLRAPTSVADLDPEARTFDLKSYDGPADFTVELPERTLSGRFWNVVVYAPILVDGQPVAEDGPPPAIDEVELSYERTDDPDLVVERIDALVTEYQDAGPERDDLLAFREEFAATVDANGGEIDQADFEQPDLSNILTFGLQQTATDAVALQLRFTVDGEVDMAVVVQFEPGA